MIDVVLPVLDEAEALPWVLSRFPAGFRAIVVDNGSTDGSTGIARALGAEVIVEPRRGFGAPRWAGLTGGPPRAVFVMDCGGPPDPAGPPRGAGRGGDGRGGARGGRP